MGKVAVIGKYNTKVGIADGQAVKTRIITQELKNYFGENEITKIDTYNWKKNPLKLFNESIKAVRKNKHVIFMTDEGGIKIFPWLLRFAKVFKKTKLHYVVVGGWLIHFLKKHSFIRSCLKKFSGIYVETTVMKNVLYNMGFKNIILMPNFKTLQPINTKNVEKHSENTFRFCTFSRIMKKKGIDDAVEAIKEINKLKGEKICSLDIYGQVEPKETEWFENLKKSFTSEINYAGVIDYDQSVNTLKNYYGILFPTEFYTEGVPGTVIDAYASAVPVIASKWESYSDVITEGETGIGYEFGRQEMLKEKILSLINNREAHYQMKLNCLKKADEYLPEKVTAILLTRLS